LPGSDWIFPFGLADGSASEVGGMENAGTKPIFKVGEAAREVAEVGGHSGEMQTE